MRKGKTSLLLAAAFFAAIAMALAVTVFKRHIYRMASDFQHPFSSSVVKIGTATEREALMMQSKSELADMVLALREANEARAAEIAVYRDMEKSKMELEALMEIPPTKSLKPIFANIVIRDPISWRLRFSINKGSADGIAIGDVALAKASCSETASKSVFALVGRVAEVSRHRALIETIASRDCGLSVIVESNLAAGTIEGANVKNGRLMIRLSRLPVAKKYIPGAEVLTSGLARRPDGTGAAVPPGLLVGRLTKKATGKVVEIVDKMTAEAEVEPAVDLDSVRRIAVMVPIPPRERTPRMEGEAE